MVLQSFDNLPNMFGAQGPADTPFEGGTFALALSVPEQYPLQAPSVRFRTKIFHPNIHFKVCYGLYTNTAAGVLLNSTAERACYATALHTV